MTETEYKERLAEDKWFDDPQQLIDYRLPCIQHYLSTRTNSIFIVDGNRFNSNEITIKYNNQTDFVLVNRAWESIKKTI